MKIFELNIKRLVTLLLPTFLRKPRITFLLRASTYSLSNLYDSFMHNRNGDRYSNIYKINHNGQVFSLRKVLNDEFDSSSRRITIDDVEVKDWLMIYQDEEAKHVMLGTKKVYREDMIGQEKADFIIDVPFVLSEDERARMHSIVNYYKLVSKRYTIQSKTS